MKFLFFKIAALTSKLLCSVFGTTHLLRDQVPTTYQQSSAVVQPKKPVKGQVQVSSGNQVYKDEKGNVLQAKEIMKALKSGQYILTRTTDPQGRPYILVKKRQPGTEE